jgi:hypothetical protein
MLAQAYPTLYNVLLQYIILKGQLQLAIEQHRGVGLHSLLANAIQEGVEILNRYLNKAKLQSVAAIATILNLQMKLQKLHKLGWSKEELAWDRRAFVDAFDAYSVRFGQTDEDIGTQDEDLDDELAFKGITNPVAFLLIKSAGNEVERYLSKPLIKKSNKQTYTKY